MLSQDFISGYELGMKELKMLIDNQDYINQEDLDFWITGKVDSVSLFKMKTELEKEISSKNNEWDDVKFQAPEINVEVLDLSPRYRENLEMDLIAAIESDIQTGFVELSEDVKNSEYVLNASNKFTSILNDAVKFNSDIDVSNEDLESKSKELIQAFIPTILGTSEDSDLWKIANKAARICLSREDIGESYGQEDIKREDSEITI